MITIEPNIDLTLLSEHFTECDDYTKEVIFDELRYWQTQPDFLVIVSRDDSHIDGFFIAYRNRNSLWVSQVWRESGTDIKESRKAFEIAKEWARERGMTSLTGETDRKQVKAMNKYGWKESSVNMKVNL